MSQQVSFAGKPVIEPEPANRFQRFRELGHDHDLKQSREKTHHRANALDELLKPVHYEHVPYQLKRNARKFTGDHKDCSFRTING